MHDETTTQKQPSRLPNIPERGNALATTPRQGKPICMDYINCAFGSCDDWILASDLDFNAENEPTLDELAQLDRLDWTDFDLDTGEIDADE